MIPQPRDEDVQLLAAELRSAARVTVLTGAGCSTESGIPDYRGPQGTWMTRRPMYFQEFIRSEESRRYFWARNYRGWPRFSSAAPNDAHHALALLERHGRVLQLITQNVDDLHHRAGQQRILELHGQSSRVVCLDCRAVSSRAVLQETLSALNREWWAEVRVYNPDGDAEISREMTAAFVVPECERCGGVLKPDVVFFGESVPKPLVDECMAAVTSSDLLLVVGSSLAVWSGYRFARAARDAGRRIVLLNYGETRADDLADLKIESSCVGTLSGVVAEMGLS